MALARDTIFIQGILARSGTNHLHELLIAHPDCCSTGRLPENFFLLFADQLQRYVESVAGRWKPDWDLDPAAREELLEGLGDGLISFLDRQRQADPRNRGARYRMVARTPHVGNLHLFFKLFPSARLIVLVRDGRDLVESFVRSFKVEYEPVMRKWAEAAQTIIEFDRAHRGGPFQYTIVRYEDLVSALEPSLRGLLAFLGLDAARYDFTAAAAAPVIGSSTFRGGAPDVHWDPVPKTADFNPLDRSREWPADRTAQFNSIAGDYLLHFGYSPR
jgi:hypothetical protein